MIVTQCALKCADLAQRLSVEAEDRPSYLSYQFGAYKLAAYFSPSVPFFLHNHLNTQKTPTTSDVFNNHVYSNPL